MVRLTVGSLQLLSRLDAETRPHHGDIDAIWIELITGELTLTKYVSRLMRVYGFESPIEAALAYTPKLANVIDVRNHARSGLIAQDLIALGFSTSQVAQLPLCPIAPFANPAEALGWMYVVQRSTQLHERTRRQLEARLPQMTRGTAYLASTEGRAALLRNELGASLHTWVVDAQMADQVIGGAQDAVRCALEWFQSRRNRASDAVDASTTRAAGTADSEHRDDTE
ncbi:MAG: heme oxygenase [Myxococcales bacterium]|nr:heme oxygenase [Myxococcales bacterium]